MSDLKKNIDSALELGNESYCFISTATLCQASNAIDDFEFNEQAKARDIAVLEEIANAVGHIGVDFGFGPYVVEEKHITAARDYFSNKGAE